MRGVHCAGSPLQSAVTFGYGLCELMSHGTPVLVLALWLKCTTLVQPYYRKYEVVGGLEITCSRLATCSRSASWRWRPSMGLARPSGQG